MRSWNFQQTDGLDGLVLKSVDGANFKGLRLGTIVDEDRNEYSITAKRACMGTLRWKLDYASESDLDKDTLKILEAVGNIVKRDRSVEVPNMSFIRLVQYNDETGEITTETVEPEQMYFPSLMINVSLTVKR